MPGTVANGHWVIYPTDTGFGVWNELGRENVVANFACSDEAGPSGTDGIMVTGGAPITMTDQGVLFAVATIGTVGYNVLHPWESIIDERLPNTNISICDAVDQEYDPLHNAFAREGQLEEIAPQLGSLEIGIWLNPITGKHQDAVGVLIVSEDKGRTWHLATSPRASVTIGEAASGYGGVGAVEGAGNVDDMVLTPAGTGVRWGDPGYGYTVFGNGGWSAVAGKGNTYGFGFGDSGTPSRSRDPGTTGPKGWHLRATQRLNNGAIWALWQPGWVTSSGGDDLKLNDAAHVTETLNGHVYDRVNVDPKFTVRDYIGGQLASPGCVEPRTALAEGIATAMPSGDGRTIYATTPRFARWLPGCHNKYVGNVDYTEALETLIASHDGGKTWSRVPAPNLGAFTWSSEVLNVDGTQPVVGFESNRHVCAKAGGLMYERLAGGHWHAIGCRQTAEPGS